MELLARRPLALSIAFLTFLGASGLACAGTSSPPSVNGFTIDPAPTVRFLTLESHGGMTNEIYLDSFFGDGHVELDRFVGGRSSKPYARWQAQLSELELQALLTDLVESGLLVFDPEAALERERNSGRMRPYVTDAGSIRISISLHRSRWLGFGLADAVTNQFWLSGSLMARPSGQVADMPEMEAFRRLVALAGVVRRRATEIEPPPEPGDLSFPSVGEPVLVLISKGSEPPLTNTLKLFSSGRAVVTSSYRSVSGELALNAGERQQILEILARGGLLAYDEGKLAEERRRILGGPLEGINAEAGVSMLSVEYRVVQERGPGIEPEPHSGRIEISGPTGLASQFPTIREYRALGDLREFLSDCVWRIDGSRR